MMHSPPPRPAPRRPAIHRAAPRAAAPVALSIGDLISVNGQLFMIGATLIPQGAAPLPTPTPTPPPPPVVPTPTVSEFRDATRQFAISVVPGGSAFSIEGGNFGAAPGIVTFAGVLKLAVPVWTDTHLTVVAPPFTPGQAPQMWTIMRADGNSQGGFRSFLGPPVVAPPPLLLQRELNGDHPPPGAKR